VEALRRGHRVEPEDDFPQHLRGTHHHRRCECLAAGIQSEERHSRWAVRTPVQVETVAKFETQTEEEWQKESWSLVLNLEGTPDEKWIQTAWVRFLADEIDAPTEWLQPHSVFALFEGRKKVADGMVLEIGG
jgi:hypothetical protein